MLQIGAGVKSGSKVNKFKEMKLTKEKANFISCPMIKESPVSVECKVREIKELGSHHMFIAEVLAIHADERYIDEKGAFDISKCDLIAYSNGGYYPLGKKIGKFGYSVQKNKIKEVEEKVSSKRKADRYKKVRFNKEANKNSQNPKNAKKTVKTHISRKNNN